MEQRIITYTVKEGFAEENENLIKAVFKSLEENQFDGIKYTAFKITDNSFMHIAAYNSLDDEQKLVTLPAFKNFISGIKERVVTPPARNNEASEIGTYNGITG